MYSCLQILAAFLWLDLITLLNVTLIILTLSVARHLNLLLRLVAGLRGRKPHGLASRSGGRTASGRAQASGPRVPAAGRAGGERSADAPLAGGTELGER